MNAADATTGEPVAEPPTAESGTRQDPSRYPTGAATGGDPPTGETAADTAARTRARNWFGGRLPAYAALARAGFLRYATYRQATVAATFTNSIFGFLRCYVLLAVVAGASGSASGSGSGSAAGSAAGYTGPQLATFVWVGQGMLGTVLLWSNGEFADRIRSGDIASDLLRPIDPVWQYVANDLGRAGHAALTRFVVPLTVGAFAFDLYAPHRLGTYPMFVLSLLLATLVCAGCRYMVEACAYWLLDARGPRLAWVLCAASLGGLAFPLWFLPTWLSSALVVATPMPSIIQLPLDILAERWSWPGQFGALAVQACWAVLVLAGSRLMQRRGERHLVVQGG